MCFCFVCSCILNSTIHLNSENHMGVHFDAYRMLLFCVVNYILSEIHVQLL
ncbi:hypothetical protein FKM82_010489 [Ascaphus truei]